MQTWRKALDCGYGCQEHLEVQKNWGVGGQPGLFPNLPGDASLKTGIPTVFGN